jgi:hypothetical protein
MTVRIVKQPVQLHCHTNTNGKYLEDMKPFSLHHEFRMELGGHNHTCVGRSELCRDDDIEVKVPCAEDKAEAIWR